MRMNRQRELADQHLRRLEDGEGMVNSFRADFFRMFRANRLAAFSLLLILLMILGAALAPVLTPYAYDDMDLQRRLSPPSAEHLLGTDEGGRDILTRLLYGARVSLMIGVVPTVLSILIGALLGMLAGWYGGITDTVIMRLADIVLAFPSMLLAMLMMFALGDGIINVVLTLAMMNWASVARIVRAETLRLKNAEYIDAARTIGVSGPVMLLRHILPNCLPTLIVLFTLNVPTAILTESSLSFLGLGIQAPDASWGLMVNAGKNFLFNAPWLSVIPGLTIMVAVLAFNFLGDGLRDALDPHLKDR